MFFQHKFKNSRSRLLLRNCNTVKILQHMKAQKQDIPYLTRHFIEKLNKNMPPCLLDELQEHSSLSATSYSRGQSLGEIMEQYEKKVLKEALHAHENNVAQCARSLGIRRETLYYRMHKLDIDPRKPL